MPKIGTQEEWQTERDALLEEEKELTRRSDELARKRRELPWVPVEKDYSFETEHGTRSLAELFDGRSQLLVYHFMFGPAYTAGCPVCSSIADTLAPQVVHLKARDTTLLLASRAPLEKLLAYRERMGWPIDWVSSGGSDFNRDLGFLHTEEELKPFLDGEIPPAVDQMADGLRDRRRRLRLRGPRPERVRARGRSRLPDLRHHRARPRAGDGLLRAARPHAPRAPRGRRARALAPPPRRVRVGGVASRATVRRATGEHVSLVCPLGRQSGEQSWRADARATLQAALAVFEPLGSPLWAGQGPRRARPDRRAATPARGA